MAKNLNERTYRIIEKLYKLAYHSSANTAEQVVAKKKIEEFKKIYGFTDSLFDGTPTLHTISFVEDKPELHKVHLLGKVLELYETTLEIDKATFSFTALVTDTDLHQAMYIMEELLTDTENLINSKFDVEAIVDTILRYDPAYQAENEEHGEDLIPRLDSRALSYFSKWFNHSKVIDYEQLYHVS